jgi:hypothetical protein
VEERHEFGWIRRNGGRAAQSTGIRRSGQLVARAINDRDASILMRQDVSRCATTAHARLFLVWCRAGSQVRSGARPFSVRTRRAAARHVLGAGQVAGDVAGAVQNPPDMAALRQSADGGSTDGPGSACDDSDPANPVGAVRAR